MVFDLSDDIYYVFLLFFLVLFWGNSVSFGNYLKLDGVWEVEVDLKLLKEKFNYDILDYKC